MCAEASQISQQPPRNKFKNVETVGKLNANSTRSNACRLQMMNNLKVDCEKLLLTYEASNNLSFEAFTRIWQTQSFKSIIQKGALEYELHEFANACYFVIKSFLFESKNVNVRVGAFYLLYGVHCSVNAVPIRMTCDEYIELAAFAKQMQHTTLDYVPYIFNLLRYGDAFVFVVTSRPLGFEAKLNCKEKKIRTDICKSSGNRELLERFDKIMSDESFLNLKKICEEYNELYKKVKGEYPKLEMCPENKLIEELTVVYKKEVEQYKNQSTPQPEQNDDIGSRRLALRQKARKRAKKD